MVESATLVAVTVTVVPEPTPAKDKSPVLEMVPELALHVTEVFVVFTTVAVNCSVKPDGTDAVFGETLTDTAGAVTVMVAFPVFVVSCELVAVTLTDPAVAGAVNFPFASIVPALADHVTTEL